MTGGIDPLIPLKEVGRLIGGFHKRTVLRMIAAGILPPARKSQGRPCLLTSEVKAYIESLKAEACS